MPVFVPVLIQARCLTSDIAKDSLLTVNPLDNNGHVTHPVFGHAFVFKLTKTEHRAGPDTRSLRISMRLRQGG